jgi:hypothetical protein
MMSVVRGVVASRRLLVQHRLIKDIDRYKPFINTLSLRSYCLLTLYQSVLIAY